MLSKEDTMIERRLWGHPVNRHPPGLEPNTPRLNNAAHTRRAWNSQESKTIHALGAPNYILLAATTNIATTRDQPTLSTQGKVAGPYCTKAKIKIELNHWGGHQGRPDPMPDRTSGHFLPIQAGIITPRHNLRSNVAWFTVHIWHHPYRLWSH